MHGLKTIISNFPVAETIDRIISILEEQEWHLFARIDHAEQARKKGLELRPTELILFGNPAIGTLLMRDCQLAAIDLPMKMLVWEDEHGQIRMAHNTMRWLQRRHGLTDEITLRAINEILVMLCASGQT